MASLNLIKNILTDKDIHYIFIIGAYRDNEVDHYHPLMTMVRDLEEEHVKSETLHLEPLKLDNITDLLTDTLHLKPGAVKPLAELTFEKTRGNAFFIKYFLTTLYQQKLLHYSHENKRWQWDIEKINEQKITDNVVDLLLSQMHELSLDQLEILSIASLALDLRLTYRTTLKLVTEKITKKLPVSLKLLCKKI